MTMSFETLKTAVDREEIDTVNVAFVDMQGRLIGKRFHARHFVDKAHDETHGCDYLLANDIDMEPVPGYRAASWEKGYGDFVIKPDLSTITPTPWMPGSVTVLADVLDHHHADVPHSPRGILKKQVERMSKRDMKAYLASELEFYLFEDSYEIARDLHYAELTTASPYIQDYVMFATSKEEHIMRQIRNGLQAAGIPVENSKGEWGPGQEEINVEYADALAMADRHSLLKQAVKEIAFLNDQAVTFMAKWNYELAGNSSHIHCSLWDAKGKKSLFLDKKDPLGMSPLMKQFVAGQLKYAAECTYFLAPYINSYKRFQAGTFAPTNIVWSRDNRTAGFRLCGENSKAIRIECRVGGADLNPYLAFAALIAAGLKGIEDKLELDAPFAGDAYVGEGLPQIPNTLRAAIAALDGSVMLREALGDDVVNHYVHTAKWEQIEYDRRVTDWELKRGFERY